jgi:phosphoribosyl 1,2-cyclic phosphodiesterase
MIIRCWGSRGSIPVSGAEYVKYGGDTTCLELRSADDEILIIDAGSGIRRLGNLLVDERRYDFTMLFTHTHWDHILGFPFFKPVFFKKSKISIQGCPFSDESLRERLKVVMHAPYFPVDFGVLPSQIEFGDACSKTFNARGFEITPIPLSHPNKGQGYRITENGRTMVFLTDNELTFRHDGGLERSDYVEFCRGADMLIHDAEFTREEYENRTKGWGHSYWESVLEAAMDAGVKRFGLYHHNQDRTDTALDEIVGECRRIITERGLHMECFAVPQDAVYTL